MCKLLQWTPLINVVIRNGSHGLSKSISFILMQRPSMLSSAIMFSDFFGNFVLYSWLSVAWRWQGLTNQVCQINTRWHIFNRSMRSPLLWKRFISFHVYSKTVWVPNCPRVSSRDYWYSAVINMSGLKQQQYISLKHGAVQSSSLYNRNWE